MWQGRLRQQVELERDGAVRAVQLELADLQQRLRMADQAAAEARTDIARLKLEQHEDTRTTEVSKLTCAPCACFCQHFPTRTIFSGCP